MVQHTVWLALFTAVVIRTPGGANGQLWRLYVPVDVFVTIAALPMAVKYIMSGDPVTALGYVLLSLAHARLLVQWWPTRPLSMRKGFSEKP